MDTGYATLLYLNPGRALSNGVTTLNDMMAFWLAASPDVRSAFVTSIPPAAVEYEPFHFFARNALSCNLDVIGIDTQIRQQYNESPGSNQTLIANLYTPVVLQASNTMVAYDVPQHVSMHVATGYSARLLYPSGKTRRVTLAAASISGSNLQLVTEQNDLLQGYNPDRLNNALLQGVYVSDSRRIMHVATAADTHSNLDLSLADPDFNVNLYKLLYPSAQGMTDQEAYGDYVACEGRIGFTKDIASVSSDMSAVVPDIEVTDRATVNTLCIGGRDVPPVKAVSRDYSTPFNLCDDDAVITERAIKTYADRTRDAELLDLSCHALRCLSNATFLQAASFCNTVTCRNAGISNATIASGSVNSLRVTSGVMDTLLCSNANATTLSTSNLAAGNADVRLLRATSSVTTGVVNADRAAFATLAASNSVCDAHVCASVWTGMAVASNLSVTSSATFSNISVSGVAAFSNGLSAGGAALLGTITCSTATAGDATITRALTGADAAFSGRLAVSSASVSNLRATLSVLGVTSSSNLATSNLVASNISASNATTSRLVASNLAASNVGCRALDVEGPVRVFGNMLVTGRCVLPPSTYINSSNIRADRLVVSEVADVQELRSLGSSRSMLMGVLRRDAPSSVARGKLRTATTEAKVALQNLMALHEDDITPDTLVDVARLCVCAIQTLVGNHDISDISNIVL